MTLSRSPSPVPGGGWSSPGLSLDSGRSTPANVSGGPVVWESAKMRPHNSSTFSSFSTQNKGFFSRHMRRLSSSLPQFNGQRETWKEKHGRGPRWIRKVPLAGRVRSIYGRMGRRLKMFLLFTLVAILCYTLFYTTRKLPLAYPGSWAMTDHLQLLYITGEDRSVAETSLSSSWAQMLEVVSWSGKVPENGLSSGTACETSESTSTDGATTWKLWT